MQASIGGKIFKKKITVRPVFEVSKTSVTCTKQTTVDVYLRDSGTLHFDVQDPTIINCKWNPFDGEKSQLVITPLKAGSTTITVTNTINSDKAVIYVTVPSSGINNPATPSFQANLYADRSPTLVILLQFRNTSSRPITINGPGVLNNGSINTNMITFDNGFTENTVVQPGKFVNLALVKTNLGYFNVNSSSLYGFYITYDNVKYIAIITYNGQLVRLTKSGYSTSALLGDAGIPDDYIAENLDPIILQQNELLDKSGSASVEVRY